MTAASEHNGFLQKICEELFNPECVLINENAANNPDFRASIRNRLNFAGHCYGDTSAELARNPELDDETKEFGAQLAHDLINE